MFDFTLYAPDGVFILLVLECDPTLWIITLGFSITQSSEINGVSMHWLTADFTFTKMNSINEHFILGIFQS